MPATPSIPWGGFHYGRRQDHLPSSLNFLTFFSYCNADNADRQRTRPARSGLAGTLGADAVNGKIHRMNRITTRAQLFGTSAIGIPLGPPRDAMAGAQIQVTSSLEYEVMYVVRLAKLIPGENTLSDRYLSLDGPASAFTCIWDTPSTTPATTVSPIVASHSAGTKNSKSSNKCGKRIASISSALCSRGVNLSPVLPVRLHTSK